MTDKRRLLSLFYLALASPMADVQAQVAPGTPIISTSAPQTSTMSASVVIASHSVTTPAPLAATPPKETLALKRARSLYFTSDVLESAAAFETAVKTSSADVTAWIDGSIAWAEAGRPDNAITWANRAVAISHDTRTLTILGWTLLRAAQYEQAEASFNEALALDPQYSWALLGLGRVKLSFNKPSDAAALLKRASADGLQQTLSDFYLGRALEALNDNEGASEAYRRAVGSDSYFHEGRHPLTRTYLQLKRYKDAWRQLSRLAEAEPSARLTRAMMDKIRPLIVGQPTGTPASGRPNLIAPTVDSETQTALPMIRVGIATTPMGKPRPRQSVTVRGSGTWRAIDPKSKRLIANCGAQQAWTLRIITTKKKKSKNRLELRGPDGELRPVPGDSVYFESDDSARGSLSLEDDPVKGGPLAAGRAMRGSIEVSLFNQRRSLRLVNILNIEDYSQGVVGAEMPAVSPLEALKAQAIMARTHALYIKSVTKRHKKEGYDICDEQHCQVYAGIHLETPRTREAVTTTRGRVVNYKGSLAHVIYSSNCGGFTQSGSDIGWGAVPYWGRVSDSAPAAIPPATPMELRRYLSNWPDAYCRPSGHVHPSHSRWSRVISAKDLEERINRKKKIGTLKGLRVLRRAPTGNVEALLILGSRKNWKLHDEFDIRSLLGVGSLRSTLFIVDTEYRTVTSPAPKSKKNKQPAPIVTLVPDAFVFRGGGWGHAVGLCQSGAIGRASAGQGFEDIIRAYFPGVEMSQLKY